MARGRHARRTVRSLGVLTAALAWLALGEARLAEACPACLGSDARNAAFLKIGSLFVLLPFLVVGVVIWVLRQAPAALHAPSAREGEKGR